MQKNIDNLYIYSHVDMPDNLSLLSLFRKKGEILKVTKIDGDRIWYKTRHNNSTWGDSGMTLIRKVKDTRLVRKLYKIIKEEDGWVYVKES